MPTKPPITALPVSASSPPPWCWLVTFDWNVSYPSSSILTPKLTLRDSSKLHGVMQVSPLPSVTLAPAGTDTTLNACVVPRVTVAQPESMAAKAVMIAILCIIWSALAHGGCEQLVLRRLRAFLTAPAEIVSVLAHHDADRVELTLRRGAELADRLAGASAGELCELLPVLVRRIDVTDEAVRLTLELRPISEGGSDPSAGTGPPAIVTAPLAIRRCGRGTRLITPQPEGNMRSAQSTSLIQLVAKAYTARQAVMRDPSRSLDQIAAAQGVSRVHFTRLLRLSHLAPQITTAILAGRAPATLTAQRLLRAVRIPDSWREQMRIFDMA